VLSLVLNGVLDYLLMQVWGVAGIAFSTTLTYLISAIVLIFILDRKLHGLRLPQLGLSVGKVAGAAALMWLGCWFLGEVALIDRIPLPAQICLIGAAGVLIYLVLLWGLRVREVRDLWAMLRQRFPVRRQSTKAV
jgi:putative peptidoglycan lipid II flippase